MTIQQEFDDNNILQAFSNKTTDSWLPSAWAIAVGDQVNEEDVKRIYTADPLALERHHVEGKEDRQGFSPVHMRCMRDHPSLSLVRYLVTKNSKAFKLSSSYDNEDPLLHGIGPLSLATGNSKSVELLQILLQLHGSETKKKIYFNGSTPLGELCNREQFSEQKDMILCLTEADSSVEVIENAISCCLTRYGKPALEYDIVPGSTKVDILLKANPESAKCDHPIHYTARYNTLDGIEYLLKIYPEAASMTDANGGNILHFAIFDNESDSAAVDEKISYICRQYPNLVHLHNNDGFTALHATLCNSKSKGVSAICQADEEVVSGKIIDSDTEDPCRQFLPLHIMVFISEIDLTSPLSSEADCLRLLLKQYPKAAGTKDGQERTPYDHVLGRNLSLNVQRLLLRADPTINPTELHRLNYEQRRMAMFLAFRTVAVGSERRIWSRLGIEEIDILLHVVSFLY